VTGFSGQAPLLGPPSIPIHDDGHMTGQSLGINPCLPYFMPAKQCHVTHPNLFEIWPEQNPTGFCGKPNA
jgi:hypothetical protein